MTDEPGENDWRRIERTKTELLQEVVNDLTEAEFAILQETLETEHKNRHLARTTVSTQHILSTIGRVVQ